MSTGIGKGIVILFFCNLSCHQFDVCLSKQSMRRPQKKGSWNHEIDKGISDMPAKIQVKRNLETQERASLERSGGIANICYSALN
jgi:hypothetical protein